MKINNVIYLFGNHEIHSVPMLPFEERIGVFLDALSRSLRKDEEAKAYPDIMTYAFWIRKSSVQKMSENYKFFQKRIGKGLLFHIAPSNVPINFAYTLAFGMLSGNSNIVKVSTQNFKQVDIICRVLHQLMQIEEYQWVQKQNAVVLYERNNKAATDYYSSICDVRIIWGGDNTINQIRESPIPPRSTEMTFADRYSVAVISTEKMLQISDKELAQLVSGFYNDTYLMDQNACSSPHLVCWIGDRSLMEQASERFWDAVYKNAQRYDLEDVKVSEKYTLLCEAIASLENVSVKKWDNLLYVISLSALPEDVTALRGKFGLFYEAYCEDLKDFVCCLNNIKIQTCAAYGVDYEELRDLIIDKHIVGVDRIVPIGKTLDIGLIWDGFDIVRTLSRCIDSRSA